jgi:PEP-CTERM motif-containing protein
MSTILRSLATAALLASAAFSSAASATYIDSTLTQSGQTRGIKKNVDAVLGAFSFSDPAASLPSLIGFSLTLTLTDGDSAAGEFDYDNLFVSLDGIDTGLSLNGFGGGTTVTQTLSLLNLDPTVADEIYQELVSDDELLVRIVDVDNDANNNAPGDPDNNKKNVITMPSNYNATLRLNGPEPRIISTSVAEPASLALAGLGLVGLALQRRRQRA